ncbi:MAG: 3-keto-5-aminohexanoate cleavage protein [Rhodospirillales bacterium]
MGRSVWIEAAINGPWGRDRQPLIPVTVDEIVDEGVACAKAGAAIVHVHAYDADSGRQRDDWQIYARIVEGIRAKVDAIVYPSIPLAGSRDAPAPLTPRQRFGAIEALAERGLVEWSIVDPGSVNFASYRDLADGELGFVYANPEAHVRHGLRLAARYGFHPSFACYEPGFVRLGSALRQRVKSEGRRAPSPIYRVLFSQSFTFSFPPEEIYLSAYHRLLQAEAADAPWMAAGLGVDLRGLYPSILRLGGHLRVGLEDAPLGTEQGNGWWLETALAAVAAGGDRVASAAEVRAALADLH